MSDFIAQVIDKVLLPQQFTSVFTHETKELNKPVSFTYDISTFVKRASFDEVCSLEDIIRSIKELAKENDYFCFVDKYLVEASYRIMIISSSKTEYRINLSKTVNDGFPVAVCNITSLTKK